MGPVSDFFRAQAAARPGKLGIEPTGRLSAGSSSISTIDPYLSRFKGKTIFLNVWATWCGPCVQEMPSIAALAKNPRLKDRGVEFVCVSVDDSSRTVRQFLEGRDWSMTFLRIGSGPTPAVFATDGIPATFLIDPNGRIAATTVGAAQWNEPEVVDFIEKLSAAGAQARRETGNATEQAQAATPGPTDRAASSFIREAN